MTEPCDVCDVRGGQRTGKMRKRVDDACGGETRRRSAHAFMRCPAARGSSAAWSVQRTRETREGERGSTKKGGRTRRRARGASVRREHTRRLHILHVHAQLCISRSTSAYIAVFHLGLSSSAHTCAAWKDIVHLRFVFIAVLRLSLWRTGGVGVIPASAFTTPLLPQSRSMESAAARKGAWGRRGRMMAQRKTMQACFLVHTSRALVNRRFASGARLGRAKAQTLALAARHGTLRRSRGPS